MSEAVEKGLITPFEEKVINRAVDILRSKIKCLFNNNVFTFGSAISEIGDLLHDIVYYACEDYRVKTFGKSKKEIREEREKNNKKKSEGDVYI